jgi:hypothetical protein
VISVKCPHCGHKNDSIKKEGYSKFFIYKKNEDSEGNEDKIDKKKQHFLNPVEVLLIISFHNFLD